MKGIYNLLFFLVFSNCLFAQKRIVNLLSALEQAKNDSQKIEAYKQLIIHYSAQKPDSADWYANEGIKYSIDKGYKVGEAKIVAQQAVLDENQGRPNKGKERDEYALKIYREQNDLKGVALTIHNLGAIEAGQGNFDIAIKYFVSALKVYDSITDYHGLMLTYMNMGNLYIEHQDTTNAWKYMSLAVQAGKNAPISEATIFLYNIIGVMYAGKGMQDTALKIFLNDLELSDKPGFVNSRAECILYLGEFYSEKGDNGQAVKYLENGLGISIENNLPEMEANFLEGIAKLQEKAHPDSAMNYLNKAKVLCENTHNKMFLANIYGEIASLYKQQGNYKEALTATEQKQKITDSVFNINKAREIANIGDAYEMEKSKMRVNQLEILSNSNAKERNVIFIIAACIIIVLVVLLIYYRKTTLLNRQLVKSKQELKEMNDLKDKLFSVIGHDLRGPIATIPVAIDIYEDRETSVEEKQFILESMKEHAKVSLETLDKLLYWGQSIVKGTRMRQVDFHSKDPIKQTVEFKKIAAAEKHIAVSDLTADNLFVYADVTHFEFIIRNLLANAIKYTHHNGLIIIAADDKSKPGFIIFSVKDNGIGMSKELLSHIFTPVNSGQGTANEKGNGIGLMLCKEFALQNGGDIWVDSKAGKGSTFYFSVKTGNAQAV